MVSEFLERIQKKHPDLRHSYLFKRPRFRKILEERLVNNIARLKYEMSGKIKEIYNEENVFLQYILSSTDEHKAMWI